jgi:hypothetical protein
VIVASSETLRQCMALAAAAAPAMVGRAVDEAVTLLQEEEQRSGSMQERRDLADAWLELTKRRGEWSRRYASLLQAAQVAAREPQQPAAVLGDRFGGLALQDDTALAREIESARVLQLLAPRLEQPLAELDALMSTALGLDTVRPERNPLRPEVFARALRELMHPCIQDAWPRLWSQHLAEPLARGIAALYADVLKLLRDAKLPAATYRVLPAAPSPTKPPAAAPQAHAAAPAGSGGGGAGPGGNGGGDGGGAALEQALGTSGALGGAAWADLSSYTLGDELFQHFLFSRAQPSSQALAPAFYTKVEGQLAAIEQAQETYEPFDADAVARNRALPPVERQHRAVGSTRELDTVWGRWAAARERSLHQARLKKEARQVGQVLGLEVVRKLVDQVAADPRLLAPVREAIVAVEPALSRLALVAPRFFAQEDHAGRRLVERVAERSFRYNDEFSSDFQEFFADVRTTFRALNEQKVRDEHPFGQALRELEERWQGEDSVEQRGRQVAVDALHFAEAREAEAGKIAWSLSQRSDLDGVPAVVQDFLFGPWSLVLAHARLTGEKQGVDPGGWNAIISDLLWSVKRDEALRDPARVFNTVPGILERLRGGLKLIGQEPAEHATFFQALEKLHRPVLKLRARTRHASHGLATEPHLDPALLSTERQQPRMSADSLWLTPSELHAAGFEEERHSAPAPLDAPRDAPDKNTGTDVAAVIARLHQGCWVDLYAKERWRRASLTWVSNRATLFMFVSHGGQPHSMTRRSLERLVRARMLRAVEPGAVVPRAIDALSQQPQDAHVAPRKPARAGEEPVAA